jgi:hypothetical protein
MKKNRISAEQYDFSQFTRNVRVYVGFTDDEEEESLATAFKDTP